jgi:hypothetical protein
VKGKTNKLQKSKYCVDLDFVFPSFLPRGLSGPKTFTPRPNIYYSDLCGCLLYVVRRKYDINASNLFLFLFIRTEDLYQNDIFDNRKKNFGFKNKSPAMWGVLCWDAVQQQEEQEEMQEAVSVG